MTGLWIWPISPEQNECILDEAGCADMVGECLERRALARTCCSAQSVLDDSLIQDVFSLAHF
jgi:hypothetical protein